MKIEKSLFLIALVLINTVSVTYVLSNEGNHEGEEHQEAEEVSGSVGPGKSIEAANRKEGIKLSQKAISTLGLEVKKVNSGSPFQLPVSSLVYFQDEVGVYRLRNGWFKLLEGKVRTRKETIAIVEISDLLPSDEVVVKGVPLLRVTELEAFGGSGEGHGH